MNSAIATLKELGLFLESALKIELQRQGHNASGQLIQSIKSTVRETVSGFEVIGSMVYYGKYVDQGRRPGAKGIPIEDMIAWIRQKKIQIPGMKERQQAFMFQASIKNKGIPASNFVNTALEGSEGIIDRKITEACGAFVDSYIDYMFYQLSN